MERKGPIRRLSSFVVTLLVAYAIVCGLAWGLQAKLTFFPSRELRWDPKAFGIDFDDVWLETKSGRVHAWFVPLRGERKPRGVALWCHGNAGNIGNRVGIVQELQGLGLDTLIIDYPGYGKSDGSPDEEGCYAAAIAAYDWLLDAGHSELSIIAWGRSLGGAVAVELASKRRCAALIIESSFTSLPDAGQRAYPWLPVRWLCSYKFDSASKLPSLELPKLILHSPDDEIIPIDLGKRLFELAAEPKRFVETTGSHNGGPEGESYRAPLRNFLSRHGLLPLD